MLFYTPGAKHYANEFYANDRKKFVTVSITGKTCTLNCAHCGGKLLHSMHDCCLPEVLLALAGSLATQGGKGILISGGSDINGAVPLTPFIPVIKQIKSLGLEISCHTGLADSDTLLGLKKAGVDKILLDIIGSAETAQNVLGIDKRPEDYERCLKTCADIGIAAVPHIILGLDFGKFKGEYRALEIVSICKSKFLVIVVLKPLRGTAMQDVPPPPLNDCLRFMEFARKTSPDIKITLGCARPIGTYSLMLEKAAVDLGFDAIAYPAPETINHSKANGHEVIFHDICCFSNIV